MKKFILLSVLCGSFMNSLAAIRIQSQIAADSPSGTLLLTIKDLSHGSVRAESLSLTPGNNLKTIEVGDVFQIVSWSLQGTNFVSAPCASTSVIDHQSLIVTLQGRVSPTGLTCSFRTITGLTQLYLPVSEIASDASTAASTAYQKIGDYLTALRQCTPGKFEATFSDQAVTYTIRGEQSGRCEVGIDAGSANLPLTCHFTANDIALLTTSSAIQSYTTGQVSPETQAFSQNIMNARCTPGSKAS